MTKMVKEVLESLDQGKKAKGIYDKLKRVKNMDMRDLRRHKIDDCLIKGSTDLLIELVLQSVARPSRVSKATCTTNEEYIDIPSTNQEILEAICKLKLVNDDSSSRKGGKSLKGSNY